MRLTEIIDKSKFFEILEEQRNRRIGRHIQGLYLHFKYKRQDHCHCFTLYGNNTICLMSDNWKEKMLNSDDPNGIYFRVEKTNAEDQLIEQVEELITKYDKSVKP